MILSNGFDMKDLIPRPIDLEKKPIVGRHVVDEKRESMSPNRFSNVQMTSVEDNNSLTRTVKISKDGFLGSRNAKALQYNSEVAPVRKIDIDPSSFMSQEKPAETSPKVLIEKAEELLGDKIEEIPLDDSVQKLDTKVVEKLPIETEPPIIQPEVPKVVE